MKKIIAILSVLIVAASLFATSGDSIKVTSKANEKTPVFAIYGSLTAISDYTKATKGEATAPVLASEDDITAKNIVAYFAVAQDNSSKDPKWAKIAQTYTITIAASEMVHETITASKTAAPTFSAATANSAAYGTGKGITSASWSSDSKVLTVVYNGNTKVDDCLLGSFTLTWTKNEELAVGLHTATITMTVSPE